jgi:site-specific DNA-methyltransferase (adenine-specific)
MSDSVQVEIHEAENLEFLRTLPSESFELTYLDPPFNSGRTRRQQTLRVEQAADGDRIGFGDRRYRAIPEGPTRAYDDAFDDYLGFLGPRLEELYRVLTPTGSLFLHLDPRESHYAKVFLDGLFGREAFQNEIVWAYDFGGRSRSRWSAKHDVILWYSKDPRHFTYRYEDIDRIPYMAPKLVGPEKARRGKTPTDVWWQTIVPTGGAERTGYPTQKPLAILSRIVRVHSNPGDRLLDVFAGSGTAGEAAVASGRHAVLVDQSPGAVEVMERRLAAWRPRVFPRRTDSQASPR